jgi:hypothetical protein
MADSRRKLNTPRLRPVKPLQIPDLVRDPDETVGCLRHTVLAAIVLLFLALAGVVLTFAYVQFEQKIVGPAGPASADPGGVTVAVKQNDPEKIAPEILEKHQAQTKEVPGFAINLGSAQSFSDLSRRFAEIAAQNAELQFDRLEPRATLTETIDGLEAQLLVGPFETLQLAEQACASIALPSGVDCSAAKIAGDLIARE